MLKICSLSKLNQIILRLLDFLTVFNFGEATSAKSRFIYEQFSLLRLLIEVYLTLSFLLTVCRNLASCLGVYCDTVLGTALRLSLNTVVLLGGLLNLAISLVDSKEDIFI
jgi:hypothetical protein